MANINIAKVKGKMGEKGLSVSALASMLSINRNTLSNYLDHPEKTPYAVVSKMAEILCDSPEEASAIFFDSNLRIA